MQTKIKNLSEIDNNSVLILYNDDINTFEHVILSLIEVYGLSYEQAVERIFLFIIMV